MQEAFVPYLNIVVPILLASCESTDGITGIVASQDTVEGLEDDEDDEGDEIIDYHVRTAFLDEKASACHALGVLAEMTGSHFLPYPISCS